MSDASAATTPSGDGVEQVELGYVAGAHGLGGHLKIKLHDATTEALVPGVALSFRARGGGPLRRRAALVDVEVDASGKVDVRVRVDGVNDRNAAEELKGTGLWIDRADLPELDDDEYYLHDLIGLPARHALVELGLGKVTGVSSNGAQDLLELSWRNERGRVRKWLCPALPGIVIETTVDEVTLDPVEGFMPEELEALFAQLYEGTQEPSGA
jgi:16S rRNA processing protein RimM